MLPDRPIIDAEIRCQVDDPDPGLQQFRYLLHGDTVGCGEKDQVTAFQGGGIRLYKGQVQVSPQIGKELRHRTSRLRTGGYSHQFTALMHAEQT
jgi:hypothetical protein